MGPTTASNPDPADGEPYVRMPLLAWTPGVTATAHDVYFGTDPDLGQADFQGRQPLEPAWYYHRPGAVPGKTYYWRIDEVGADGQTIFQGDVWSFTAAPATAYSPQPWNGLDGVDVNADLAWIPGIGAISHDIYFGSDRAAVKAGDPATFQGNQAAMTFDPGVLAGNTTYYWRIDEHDLAGDVHSGTVWDFTTLGPGLGVHAQYFRGMELAGAPVVTRTEDSIDHNWGNGEVAGGLSDGVSARWTTDFEAPLTEAFQLITTSDDGVRLWLDGRRIIDNWTTHGSTDDVATVHLVAGQFYHLRMEWFDNTGGAVARLSWQSPSIARQPIPAGILQLPGRATDPYPANASVSIPQTPILHWTASESATHHDVYFGQDAEAVAWADPTVAGVYQGRQDAASTTFDPGELEWNKTYSWRVDEVNEAGAGSLWKGSLWSFTTADFLVVDDFETYTDDEGNRIYQTWLDDYADTGCGSTVGYFAAPFAEQTIVHSGRQSMPLDYNNVCLPHYSQAEREFSVAQDWTVEGVNTLVLYVRGRAGNVAAPLYVLLQDSAGKLGTVRHPDAAIAQTAKWTRWKIPLSEFTAAGVNVARIKKISIGVGDKTQPAPGSYGMIFIDDIRVIR
jgi:mannan endo-1,4-beta-mannosidase